MRENPILKEIREYCKKPDAFLDPSRKAGNDRKKRVKAFNEAFGAYRKLGWGVFGVFGVLFGTLFGMSKISKGDH